jgi:hypothetical protein
MTHPPKPERTDENGSTKCIGSQTYVLARTPNFLPPNSEKNVRLILKQ